MEELTNLEIRILDFEARDWAGRGGAKENEIHEKFKMSWITYYRLLAEVIDKPAALRYNPTLVGRLCRLRDGSIKRKYVRR